MNKTQTNNINVKDDIVFLELNHCSKQDADHLGFLGAFLAQMQPFSVMSNLVLYCLPLDKVVLLGTKINVTTNANLGFGIALYRLAIQVIQNMLVLIFFIINLKTPN